MKKVKLLFLTLFAFLAFAATAQNPVVSWRFANHQVIPGDSAQFDVELKCDQAGTFHSSTQVYFNYNTLAFGENIAGTPPGYTDRKIRHEKLELLAGDVSGSFKYNVVNDANNKPYRFAIIIEAAFVVPSTMFMNEVGTDWKGYMRFTIAISDMNELAGIEFVPEDGGVGLMNGGQYYVSASNPSETKYGNPPNYEGIYENDLLTWAFLQPGTLAGIVTDFTTGLGIDGATVTADGYSTITAPDGTYTMDLEAGTYDVTAEAACYTPQTQTGVLITAGNTTTADFPLSGSEFGIVEGTVTDVVTMNPIDGVAVTMGAYSTTTDPTGFYQMIDVTPGTYDITFDHVDYLSGSINGVLVECNMTQVEDIALIPTSSIGTIDGTVTDLITTNPLENVLIDADGYTTMTAADGTYSINLPAGTYDVTATLVCYATGTQTGVIVPAGGNVTVDFELDPQALGDLEGYVIDDVTQLGIENADVTFGTYSATTDATGYYFVDDVDEGTYDVTATHPDYNSNTVVGVNVVCGQTTQQDIELHPLNPPNPILSWQYANDTIINDSLVFDVQLKCSFPGTYHSSSQIYFDYNTDAFGQSIFANNKISYEKLELLEGDITGTEMYTIVNAIDNTPSRFAIVFEASFVIPDPAWMNEVTTDWKGFMKFKIAITDPINVAGIDFVAETGGVGLMDGGQYYVDAYHPNETKYGDPPNYPGNYVNDLLNYQLFIPGTLTGIVQDANTGLGIEDATVYHLGLSTITGPSGDYSLELPAGNGLDVTAEKVCYNPQTLQVDIVAGQTTFQNFLLDPNPIGTVEGYVTDINTTQGIVGASVQIGASNATTVADGFYTMDVAAGTYDGTASAAGYEDLTIPGIVVECQQITTQDFALTPSVGTITGTITDCTSGNEIVGAVITTNPGSYTATTGAGGTYTITDVQPDTYTLAIEATGYFNGQIIDVIVTGGQTTTADGCLDAVTPPGNLTADVNCTTVELTWTEPGGGTVEELIYDNGVNTGAYSYEGYTMATHMSPSGPCKVLVMKFFTSIQAGDNTFNATMFEWAGTEPGTTIIYEEVATAIDDDWMEVDIASQNITFSGDFVVGFGSINATTFVGYDAAYNNGRSWDYDNAGSWASWNEAYLIRAIVEYSDGTIAEIGGVVETTNIISQSPVSQSAHPTDYSNVVTVDPVGNLANGPSEDLIGYNVYRDGALIASPTTPSYTEDVPAGTYEYCVSAVYDEGESTQICETVTTENCLAPVNLDNDYPGFGYDFHIFWDEPSIPGDWITWT
ncbi:MAG: carboxypeptidase-like regulatory domain-containing protein, partial [Bacteroidales bacterium]|nr:carboxypeptidase-like regulatory domain-containing protein [Bacteroidales bacterium]